MEGSIEELKLFLGSRVDAQLEQRSRWFEDGEVRRKDEARAMI